MVEPSWLEVNLRRFLLDVDYVLLMESLEVDRFMGSFSISLPDCQDFLHFSPLTYPLTSKKGLILFIICTTLAPRGHQSIVLGTLQIRSEEHTIYIDKAEEGWVRRHRHRVEVTCQGSVTDLGKKPQFWVQFSTLVTCAALTIVDMSFWTPQFCLPMAFA